MNLAAGVTVAMNVAVGRGFYRREREDRSDWRNAHAVLASLVHLSEWIFLSQAISF